MHPFRPWSLLASAALCLLACAPPPPARLTPQGSAVRVGKAHPASAATVLGPVDGESGNGCSGFGTLGTYEASEADLRNRASAMGANYIEIQRVIAPHDNGTQCADNRMTIHGVAYRTVETPPAGDLTPRIAIGAAAGDAPSPPIVPEPATVVALPPPAPRDAECTSSADCVLDCPTPAGCCGWACGCKNAVPRARVASFEADYAKNCTRPPHCLAMGCAYEPAAMAVCVNGRCTASSGFAAPAVAPARGQ